MHLMFLGKPGSGKGTQAALLSKKLSIPAISIGQILRKIGSSNSSLAKKIRMYTDKGNLIPAQLSIDILKKRLSEKDCKKGYILDGFPRNLMQAKLWKEPVDKVFLIDIPNKIVLERIIYRRNCIKGHLHNLKTNPPKNQNYCDVCGEKLTIREDDKPTVIKNRLAIFKKNSLPAIHFYKKKNMLVRVDGNLSVQETFAEILKHI